MGRSSFRSVVGPLITLAVAGCGLIPVPSPRASGPITFAFDVENRTQRTLIVSVASDGAATMPEFAGGQRGTVSITILNPTNGIGVEIIEGPCALVGEATLPTPIPFTLVIENGSDPTSVTLSTLPNVGATPMPQPAEAGRCSG
jgi:hypothetical protein